MEGEGLEAALGGEAGAQDPGEAGDVVGVLEQEVAEAVGDRAAAVAFDALQDVRVVADDEVGAAGEESLRGAALGVVGDEARGPLLFYLLAYTITTVGSMAVVGLVSGGDVASERLHLDEWAGLGQRKPAAALGMHAIKVTSGEQALADLSAALGLELAAG